MDNLLIKAADSVAVEKPEAFARSFIATSAPWPPHHAGAVDARPPVDRSANRAADQTRRTQRALGIGLTMTRAVGSRGGGWLVLAAAPPTRTIAASKQQDFIARLHPAVRPRRIPDAGHNIGSTAAILDALASGRANRSARHRPCPGTPSAAPARPPAAGSGRSACRRPPPWPEAAAPGCRCRWRARRATGRCRRRATSSASAASVALRHGTSPRAAHIRASAPGCST